MGREGRGLMFGLATIALGGLALVSKDIADAANAYAEKKQTRIVECVTAAEEREKGNSDGIFIFPDDCDGDLRASLKQLSEKHPDGGLAVISLRPKKR